MHGKGELLGGAINPERQRYGCAEKRKLNSERGNARMPSHWERCTYWPKSSSFSIGNLS